MAYPPGFTHLPDDSFELLAAPPSPHGWRLQQAIGMGAVTAEVRSFDSANGRITAARAVARHPKIVVTGFEAGRPSAYTVDTIGFLKRRYPSVDFVWLMGADNLASFHRWREWEKLFGLVPIAVLDRPGYRLKARASRAAQRFAFAALDESDARGLAAMEPPAWTLLSLPLSSLSSTRLRGGIEGEPPRAKTRKAPKAVKKLAKKAKKTAKQEKKQHAKQAKTYKKDTTKSKKAAKRH